MNCSKCGYDNEERFAFCAGCGTPLTHGDSTVPIEDMPFIVPEGTDDANAVHAPYVGNDAVPLWHDESAPAAVREASLPPLKKKKSKLPLIIAVVAVVLAGAVAVTATVFGVNAKNTKEYNRLIDAGEKYLQQLEYEEAVEVFIKAIDVQPKREEAYVGAATGYIGLEQPEKAKEILEKGVENIKKPSEVFTDLCDELGVAYEDRVEVDTTLEIETTEEFTSETATETTTEESTMPAINAVVGEIVYFGRYEQDNDLSNGKEPIAWRVLSAESGKALLLAEKILDAKPYNVEYEEVTWETCTLRAWLNNEFYTDAFNAEEKAKIHTTRVVNEDGPYLDTPGGNDTNDKVFLLSYSEVTNPAYGFSLDPSNEDPARQAQGTDFSKSNGLWVSEDSSYLRNSDWWLRTPGRTQNHACSVHYDGYVDTSSNYVSTTYIGVRPALWVNL